MATQIATDVAATLMAVFAGRTVAHEVVLAEITTQYAYAKKRTGVTSYFKITDLCERMGATHRYTGPNYTGECLYTFPAINLDVA